ncbi:hypothetical protein AC623_16345 [Bacillus sp. FJAT-27231]|uniref:hypothetical protein n=1 Tax=Bacillus sp. FJAT-27231 TaxID=1679168 RepID=UPI000671501E|nr:hypothetical protein [Bacillus sp. FJAT-27231]KMY55310.1 hypothetical protein AC623_16345 [Bacillus sp. FJAT-27231]
MKTLFYCLPLFILILLGSVTSTAAQEVSPEDMEEVLVAQFHTQISESIKAAYHVRFPQFEKAHIISIKKAALPEPSEEMKPGTEYEIMLKVNVLNVPRKENALLITISNSESNGKFVVKEMKKSGL